MKTIEVNFSLQSREIVIFFYGRADFIEEVHEL
jgi:hypothetical protein